MSVMQKSEILAAIDQEEIAKSLSEYRISYKKSLKVAKTYSEMIVERIFDRKETDVIDASDAVAKDVCDEYGIEEDDLIDFFRDDTDIAELYSDMPELTLGKVIEVIVEAGPAELFRSAAQTVRDTITDLYGSDPCSFPNTLTF